MPWFWMYFSDTNRTQLQKNMFEIKTYNFVVLVTRNIFLIATASIFRQTANYNEYLLFLLSHYQTTLQHFFRRL